MMFMCYRTQLVWTRLGEAYFGLEQFRPCMAFNMYHTDTWASHVLSVGALRTHYYMVADISMWSQTVCSSWQHHIGVKAKPYWCETGLNSRPHCLIGDQNCNIIADDAMIYSFDNDIIDTEIYKVLSISCQNGKEQIGLVLMPTNPLWCKSENILRSMMQVSVGCSRQFRRPRQIWRSSPN